jgi:hypothetical protein
MGRDGTAQLKWSGLLPELLVAVARSGRSHGGCMEPTVVRRTSVAVCSATTCARQQEKLQEIAPALGNSNDCVLDGYGVYDSGFSIGVGCDGGQLASPDRMADSGGMVDPFGLDGLD